MPAILPLLIFTNFWTKWTLTSLSQAELIQRLNIVIELILNHLLNSISNFQTQTQLS